MEPGLIDASRIHRIPELRAREIEERVHYQWLSSGGEGDCLRRNE
jgi:hypothetical protein